MLEKYSTSSDVLEQVENAKKKPLERSLPRSGSDYYI
jgi:hypothetical protein